MAYSDRADHQRSRSLADRREQYEGSGLDVASVDLDPIVQWQRWYDDAVEAQLTEPHAMTISTVDADGRPNVRVVLARKVDGRGFVFFTNYESAKSREIDHQPAVALNFAWLGLHRQVRIRGVAQRLDETASDVYFASRPRGSQIGAWASPQSTLIDDREALDRLVEAATTQFSGREVDRPPNWGGWVVTPHEFEFWQGRPDRLHDRVAYFLVNKAWQRARLAP